MQNKISFFTSVNSYYLSKAISLGISVKKNHPNADFYILFCENRKIYDYKRLEKYLSKLKIRLLSVEDIGISDINTYLFQRQIVEACTAVKGRGLVYLQNKYEKTVYLDPDIYVFKPLNKILNGLNNNSIILIPHQNLPSSAELEFGVNAEITSLQYGVFNLGFLAVSNSLSAKKFAIWWAERLDKFCFDDRAKGLFTDQKWCDLAPALFEGVFVEREPGFNTAPWNSHCYKLAIEYGTGKIIAGIKSSELVFFHFSGLDSGEGLKTSTEMEDFGFVHRELYLWYTELTNQLAEEIKHFIKDWTYGYFWDGVKITPAHRSICKRLIELKVNIGDPYSQSGKYYIESHLKNIKNRE